jgi:hypothetical protein
MIVQLGEFLQKCATVSGCAFALGTVGFCGPLLFDRDVNGAAAATILRVAGLIVGAVIGIVVVRRRFD